MRRNSQSHLDDIAKRFAATAPRRREEPTPAETGEFDTLQQSQRTCSGRARLVTMAVIIACLIVVTMVGLLLLRR